MTDRKRSPVEASVAGRSWLLGAAMLVLLFHINPWQRARNIAPLALPETPIERVRPDWSRQWAFLMDARNSIPPGADYTVRAATPDEEMALYILSMGVFPRSRSVPFSYYGVEHRTLSDAARFVIDEDCRNAERPPAEVVARFRGGCVRRR